MAVTPNAQRLIKLLGPMEVSIATVKPTTLLEVSGKQKHTNASGSWVYGLNTVAKNVNWGAGVHLTDGVIDSGAISLPRNAQITKLTWVLSVNTVRATSTLSVRAGQTAGAEQYTAGSAGNLQGSDTTLARGYGISTDPALSTALNAASGPATLVAGSGIFDTGGEVHMQLSASIGAFTAGGCSFVCEFLYLGDDA